MKLEYRSIKDLSGALSRSFVTEISRHFALSTFLETGTFMGDTIAALSQDFDKLISIELSEDLHEKARRRFSNSSNVTLMKGDSAGQLPRALGECGESGSLIWLDAHYSGSGTAKGARNTPILEEVESIRRYGSGKDVILIDDLRLFWEVREGFLQHESIGGYPSADAVIDRFNQGGVAYDFFVLLDALLVVPRSFRNSYLATPVLAACTESRIWNSDVARARQLEHVIATAQGSEESTLSTIPEPMNEQIKYGLGGHFFCWRGLMRERSGDISGAEQDFGLARTCGVTVAARTDAPRGPMIERRPTRGAEPR
jgi:hypothetical protein